MDGQKADLRATAGIEEKNLRFREIGKGFIMYSPNSNMPKGRRLVTAYSDQHNRSYILMNGTYEPLTDQHRFLAVG